MENTIDGKKIAKEIELRLKTEIANGITLAGRQPGLAVLRVGDDPASGVYVANKEKACFRIGIRSFVYHVQKNISLEDLIQKVQNLNNDDRVDGILLQLPLPKHLDERIVLQSIAPSKDADGLHALNLGKLIKGEKGPRSCTPAGVMGLLSSIKFSLEGKRAVVVGRSILVGKPMALMLEAANATVTVAHSKTKDLKTITREAEVLVVAAGKPQFIGIDHVAENAVVIDVGIHRVPKEGINEDKKRFMICGDVRTVEVSTKAAAITPVPGGVGPMTVAMLLVNTVSRWQEHCDLSFTISDLLP